MDEFSPDSVVRPGPEAGLGFASWMREIVEAARATFATPHYPDGLPRGNGETVLLIPGFLAGDWTMHSLRDFLRHLDYRAEFAGVMLNLGPTNGFLPYLEHAVERLHGEAAEPIVVIGQSLGGAFARALAHRHAEKIAHVVTLASPIRFPVATPLDAVIKLLAPLHGPDALSLREEIERMPPVPVTALYSKEDGIIDWRCCLQEESGGCRNIEVSGAHSAMGFNPEAQAVIAQTLAEIREKRSKESKA